MLIDNLCIKIARENCPAVKITFHNCDVYRVPGCDGGYFDPTLLDDWTSRLNETFASTVVLNSSCGGCYVGPLSPPHANNIRPNVVLQYNYGFFNVSAVGTGIVITLTMGNTSCANLPAPSIRMSDGNGDNILSICVNGPAQLPLASLAGQSLDAVHALGAECIKFSTPNTAYAEVSLL